MSEPLLSVIIASHKRPHKLQRVLRDLTHQSLPASQFEVIVSHDGPAEPISSVVAPLSQQLSLTLLEGPKAGPAAVRNRALSHVQSELTLLLNDDVWCEPSLLRQHLARHVEGPGLAWMGTFVFPPTLLEDPFHRALEQAGLIGTAGMNPGVPLAPTMCWTGNLSMATQSLREVGGFDEAFVEPKGEDVDLGYRLAQRGVALRYTEKAVAWHDHPHDLAQWWDRAAMIGRALAQLAAKHRDPLFWPGGAVVTSPHDARRAHRRLLAQEPTVASLQRWIERLVRDDVPPGAHAIDALGQTLTFPRDAQGFLEIALTSCSLFVQQRAFWASFL